jgi:hypothetical protein
MGAVYSTRPTTTRDVTGAPIITAVPLAPATNMSPDFSMPESPAGSARPAMIIDQVIPGVTTSLPTPSDPTVKQLSPPFVIPATTAPAAAGAPWYQWFVDHPYYTGGIVLAGGLLFYSLTKKKKRK